MFFKWYDDNKQQLLDDVCVRVAALYSDDVADCNWNWQNLE